MSSDIPDHIVDTPDLAPIVDSTTLPIDDSITDAGANTDASNGRSEVSEMVTPDSQTQLSKPTETIVWRYSIRDLIDEFCWGCLLIALAVTFHVLTEEHWKAIGAFFKEQLSKLPDALNKLGVFLIDNPLVSCIIAVVILYWIVLLCVNKFRKKGVLQTDEIVSSEADQATAKKIKESRPIFYGILLTAIAVICIIFYQKISITDVLRWGFDAIVIVYWLWLLCIFFMRKYCTRYTLTPMYFELQHGFFSQKNTRISLADIEQVNVIRTLWERMIGTGTIQLRTKDQKMHEASIQYQNFRGILEYEDMQKKIDSYRLYFRTQVMSAVVRG